MADAAYASNAQIAAYLGVAVGTLPSNIDRLAIRASEVIDSIPTLRPFTVDADTDLPTDADAALALAEAASAQIEYWSEIAGGLSNLEDSAVGDSFDVLRLSGPQKVGKAEFPSPSKYAPRALAILRRVGLLGSGPSQAFDDRGSRFFAE